MNKNVKNKKKSTPVQQKDTAKKNTLAGWLKCFLGIKSILFSIVCCLLLYTSVSKNNNYKWVWNNLLKGNWDVIRKNSALTLEERYQMKLGFSYVYYNYIKQHTPDDAVILFPLKEQNLDSGGDYKLTEDVNNKFWVTHFVYPRKVVYKDEKEINPLYNEVTHVAIVAGHGYDDLDYFVTERTYFTVLPKKQIN